MSAHHTFIDTDIGRLTLTAEDGTLTGVYFPHHWRQPKPERLGDEGFDPVFTKTETQLGEYLAGDRQSFDLPLTLHGDDFQRRVWKLLEEIPYGATTTYGELADRLGNRALAQTVGKAVGDNPVSIIVPCHRVVGSDGKLTGYAGGLERKRALLDLEEPRDTRLF